MFKLAICIFAAVAAVSAKPGVIAPVAYTAVPSSIVAPLATSYQSVVRNYNGLVSPYLAAPYTSAALTYPYASAPYTSAALTYPYASAYSAYTGYPYASAYSYPYSPVIV